MAQHAAEGQFEVVLVKSVFGAAGGQHGTVDHHHLVAEVGHHAEVVGRYQNQMPLRAQLAEQIHNRIFGFHINAGKRLIQ